MSKEKKDLEEYVRKQMTLEHEQKLLLMGVMKGMQLASIVKSKDAEPNTA